MKAAYEVAQANLEQARWSLARTEVHAASDGYITNLQARVGNYATAGVPLVALIDTHSFYVQGYFEETKLRHIAPGKPAEVVLYSGDRVLRGGGKHRARHSRSEPGRQRGAAARRQAERALGAPGPAGAGADQAAGDSPDLVLIAGTTCTITIGD